MPAFPLLWLFVLLLIGWPMASLAAVQLDAPRVEMAGYVSMYIDTGKHMTIEQVANPRGASNFTQVPGQVGLGLVNGVVWLRFSAQNLMPTKTEWWLEVQPAYNDHIDLYVPDAAGNFAVRHAGSSLPFSVREIAYRNPVFKLTPSELPETYYLRIDAGKRVKVRLTFWQPSAFVQATGLEQIAFGIYLGVFLLLVLTSLWFELVLRDRVYLYFGLFVFSAILTTLTTTGLWQQYVLPDQPRFLNVALGFSVPLLIGSGVQFLFRWIGMERQQPRLSTVFLTTMWSLCTLTFVMAIFGQYAIAMHWFSKAVFFVIAPSLCILLIRPALHSDNEVRYGIIIGWLLLMVSYFFHTLASMHVIRPNVLADNAMYIGSMAFFLTVHYAISRRYNTMRLAQQVAQMEALRLSRRSTQELEVQVNERTVDLSSALGSAEAALVEALKLQKEQRQFITMVSHELRTPLAVIDASAQNLARESAGLSIKSQVRFKKIQQATKRLSSLFDVYLNDERLDNFSQNMNLQEILIEPLLWDAADAVQSLTDRHQIQIGKIAPPGTIWAEPSQLRLVLRTLVDNAVKYTPPGTVITLNTTTVSNGWMIEVIDTGPGIPQNERAYIFDRYFRGRASAYRIGTGLGLNLALRVAELHHGSLKLLDTAGGGCTFQLFLPRLGV